MKIEKVNENQICCTLTREDLEYRQVRVSELAYGSEKAKRLFQDMIQEANQEFGFETEEFPIMVEAIPMSEESLVILITKIEYPEELDSRFSDFSESWDEYEAAMPDRIVQQTSVPGAADVIEHAEDTMRIYSFESLDLVERFAYVTGSAYKGENSLYRCGKEYILILKRSSHTPQEFNRICNVASEYAHLRPFSETVFAHYKEQGRLLIDHYALQTLGVLTGNSEG